MAGQQARGAQAPARKIGPSLSPRTNSSSLNRVQPGSFLTLHYRLSGPDGAALVDTFGDAAGDAVARHRRARAGDGGAPARAGRGQPRHRSSSSAGEAFGERNPELLQRVKRTLLAEHGDADDEYRVGDVVQFPTPDGQASFAGVVREVERRLRCCSTSTIRSPAGR